MSLDLSRHKWTIISAVGGAVGGAAIGAMSGFVIDKKERQKKKDATPKSTVTITELDDGDEANGSDGDDNNTSSSIVSAASRGRTLSPEPEAGQGRSRRSNSPSPSPSPSRKTKTENGGATSNPLMNGTYHVKHDSNLVSCLTNLGKFSKYNEPAYEHCIKMCDRLYDIESLSRSSDVRPKASYAAKASRYRSAAIEAAKQLFSDTRSALRRTHVQIDEFQENLSWLQSKLNDVYHNVDLTVKDRIQRQSISG